MALSGSVEGGGGLGGSVLRLEWDASQNYGANQSTINVRLYLVLRGGTSTAATESGNINIDGNVSGFSRGSTNRGTNSTSLIHAYSIIVGHDGVGNRSFGASGFFDSGWSSFPNLSVSGSWSLNEIPRYADITSFNFNQVTDEKIQWTWGANAHCDYVSWWSPQIDGGAHHDIPVSGSSGFSITRANLPSDTQHAIYVAVRRADSGLWREAGPYYATTSEQNNFMDFADII